MVYISLFVLFIAVFCRFLYKPTMCFFVYTFNLIRTIGKPKKYWRMYNSRFEFKNKKVSASILLMILIAIRLYSEHIDTLVELIKGVFK